MGHAAPPAGLAGAAASRTTEPGAAPSCAAHRRPAALVGSHTTPSGISVTTHRRGDLAAVGGDGDPVAVGDAERRRRSPPRPGRRRRGPCRRGTARRPAAGRRRAAATRSRARPRRRPAAPARAAATGANAARSPSQRPISSISRAGRGDVGQRRGRRPSRRRARAARGRRACALVPRSTSSNGPVAALPVDERAGLLDGGGDGQHDVGPLGHRRRAQLEADDERRGVERGQRGGRVGQVVAGRRRRRAARGPRRCARAARIADGVAARAAATGGRRPRRWRRRRGRRRRRRAGRRAAGSGSAPALERAALTGPARHPGEPGAGGLDQPDDRGQRAGHRRQPLADQHHGAGAGSARQRRRLGVAQQRVEHLGLGAGRRRRAACRTASPGRGSRTARPTCTARPLRTALRSRRNRIGDSSSGSSPTSSTDVAFSRSS